MTREEAIKWVDIARISYICDQQECGLEKGKFPCSKMNCDEIHDALSMAKEALENTVRCEEKPKVDWYKVPKDTRVIVWDFDTDHHRRYFSHYDGEFFYTFDAGGTSWSKEGEELMCWEHCKLAEDKND